LTSPWDTHDLCLIFPGTKVTLQGLGSGVVVVVFLIPLPFSVVVFSVKVCVVDDSVVDGVVVDDSVVDGAVVEDSVVDEVVVEDSVVDEVVVDDSVVDGVVVEVVVDGLLVEVVVGAIVE